MKLFRLLLVIILFCCFRAYSQSGLLMSVYGQVKQFNTNVSIPGVKIELQRWDNEEIVDIQIGKSDNIGNYKINYLIPGKYTFSIDIPNIGSIYIGTISNDGTNNNNNYEFTINEGQNVNFNIIIGENPFPWIQRVNSKDGNQITFTMLYTNEMKNILDENGAALAKQVTQNKCPNLKVYPTVTYIIPDDWPLISTDQEEGTKTAGVFSFWRKIAYHSGCYSDKCKYSVQAAMGGYILMHTFDWYKNLINLNYNHSDNYINCKINCIQDHELAHSNDFSVIVESEWCKLLEKVKNININCDCNGICKDHRKVIDIIREFIKSISEYLESRHFIVNTNSAICEKKCVE